MQHNYELNWTEFCFFSANIAHVFGKKDLSELYSLYLHTRSALQAQAMAEGMRNQVSKPVDISQLNNQPSLIVSFHYGMYWQLPCQLLQQGCKIVILVSQDVMEKQKKLYMNNSGMEFRENLVFIDAELPSVFFEIKKLSAKGYHILCYIDGGVGTLSLSTLNRKSLIELHFGQGVILVRKGIIEIAYLLNLPVFCYQKPNNTNQSANPVSFPPDNGMSRTKYVERILIKIYCLLNECIDKDLTLWEGWYFMHNSLLPKSKSSHDDSLYLPWCTENRYYLMNVYNYESREVRRENFSFVQDSVGYQLDIR